MKKEQLDKDNATMERKVSIGLIVVIISFFAVAISMDTGWNSKITGLVTVGGGCDTDNLKIDITDSYSEGTPQIVKRGEVLSYDIKIVNELSQCTESRFNIIQPLLYYNLRMIGGINREFKTTTVRSGRQNVVRVYVIIRNSLPYEKHELIFTVSGVSRTTYKNTVSTWIEVVSGAPTVERFDILIHPIEDIPSLETQLTFKWKELEGAECYTIFMDNAANVRMFTRSIMASSGTENSYTLPANLQKGQYTWGVEAYNFDGNLPAGFVCIGQIGITNSQDFWIGTPVVASIIVEPDQAITQKCSRPSLKPCSTTVDSITLSWDDVTGATEYSIRKCKLLSTCDVGSIVDAEPTIKQFDELLSDTKYYFKVKVSKSDGECNVPSDEAVIWCKTTSSTDTGTGEPGAADAVENIEVDFDSPRATIVSTGSQISGDRTMLYQGWNLISVTEHMIGNDKTIYSMAKECAEGKIIGGHIKIGSSGQWRVVMGTDPTLPTRIQGQVDVGDIIYNFPRESKGSGLLLKVGDNPNSGTGQCRLNCGLTGCS